MISRFAPFFPHLERAGSRDSRLLAVSMLVLILLCGNLHAAPAPPAFPRLNLALYGRLITFEPQGQRQVEKELRSLDGTAGVASVGVRWDEDRDVREIRMAFQGPAPGKATVEYWSHEWPYAPPQLPTIEDPADDRWQGEWRRAETKAACMARECAWTFAPLSAAENPHALHLPGVTYRRTLAIRVMFPAAIARLTSLMVFSGTRTQPLSVRVALGQDESRRVTWSGRIEVDNGFLRAARPWQFDAQDSFSSAGDWKFTTAGRAKGLVLHLAAAKPDLPGSNDVTVVTVRVKGAGARIPLCPQPPAPRFAGGQARTRVPLAGEDECPTGDQAFSFRTDDLAHGPIYIPALHAYVATAADRAPFPAPRGKGEHIRRLIPKEPEQALARATREIPPLDPWEKQNGEQIYFPLAADSSWQKFAVRYDGHVFISKGAAKVKGRERTRLLWDGDTLLWRIGTGAVPYYRADRKVRVAKLNGYLPVMEHQWTSDGLEVSQETFVTLLRGPLAPAAPRDEQTPAVLLLQLTFKNPGAEARQGVAWLSTSETLRIDGNRVLAIADRTGARYQPVLRAVIDAPHAALAAAPVPTGTEACARAGEGACPTGARVAVPVPAGATARMVFKLPFVSDLAANDLRELDELAYDRVRERVVSYWQQLVNDTVRFSVPEEKFSLLLRAVVPHIHISATRDPRSGLFMAPAASYAYDVFANEAVFQSVFLDFLGDHQTAAAYLDTFLALQGTHNYAGIHTDPKHAILKGARVDDVYDYTTSNYGLDNGTILWASGLHALITGDAEWLERAWPHLDRSIAWVEEQRRTTMKADPRGGKVPEYGLLPASDLEDPPDWAYWFAVNAYAWAGMDRIAQALERSGHPEAGRIRRKADAYRSDLRAAIVAAVERSPVTQMRDGTYAPWVPVQPHQRFRYFGPLRQAYYSRYGPDGAKTMPRLSATREVLYGPMTLLQLGVFDVNEPIAEWILDDWEDNQTLSSGLGLNVHGYTDDQFWFSQGGLVFQANLQNPIEVYLRRGEIPAAIRTLYNAFVACSYPGVNVFAEEFRMWRHASGPFYKISDEARFGNRVRDLLVQERGDELWLAGGIPRRWLEPGEGVGVNRISTLFGDVSYTMRPARPGWIEARITLAYRTPPGATWLALRVPSGKIAAVTVNGKETQIDAAREAVQLPRTSAPITVHVRYE